ncbi:helix-turn-helix transcriptional regulator [Streptomyces katrae]|uniref:AraC family transcriptional regulator n=1 Tax=Streptomyces katrae TaxID=68223 RepID=A0A0F4ITY4_9ACTN|nr:AraC family transcriptional regulator [Streptomyces katrae]KJY25470.1 AraC family transcriptional regulator [Streptomyces katrae]
MCKPEWGRARVRAQRLAELTRLRRVRDRIDREFARPLDVEALAREVNMSAGQLSRQFRAAYGESPYGYLMKRRIERATVLLGRGGLAVTEVCSAVGCASPGAFTSRFTELVGVPPGAFVAGRVPGPVRNRVPGPVRNREAPAAARLVA